MKVDKGIPIPTSKKGGGGKGKWQLLLEKMNVGDSVLVTEFQNKTSMFGAAKSLKMKITTRAEDDGFRVWRIK